MNEVRNILIGMEIGEKTAQLCYFDRRAAEPVSIPTKVGTNQYAFPMSLVKMAGKDEWHFGFEADYFGKRENGIAVPSPFETAAKDRTVTVDGTEMCAHELLAVFIRESLRMLGVPHPVSAAAGICVTTDALTRTLAANIRKALVQVGFRPEVCHVCDHEESFYYYGYSMKPEVRAREMGLIRFSGNLASFSRMEESRSRKPSVVTVTETAHTSLPEDPEARDAAFSEAVSAWTDGMNYSGIFITGEGFGVDWAVSSVKTLSRAASHVFEGDNLFVKGACWAVFELLERHAFTNRLYLGPDQIRATVGIDVIENGKQVFLPLVKAGRRYDSGDVKCEIILDGREDLLVTVQYADRAAHRNERIILEGLPERPPRATRIRLTASTEDVTAVKISAEDLGFGEMYPATHQIWTMQVALDGEELKHVPECEA